MKWYTPIFCIIILSACTKHGDRTTHPSQPTSPIDTTPSVVRIDTFLGNLHYSYQDMGSHSSKIDSTYMTTFYVRYLGTDSLNFTGGSVDSIWIKNTGFPWPIFYSFSVDSNSSYSFGYAHTHCSIQFIFPVKDSLLGYFYSDIGAFEMDKYYSAIFSGKKK